MTNENNYQPKTPDIKYNSLSKGLMEVCNGLGALVSNKSLKKGNSIEFPSLGIVIKSGNFKVKD